MPRTIFEWSLLLALCFLMLAPHLRAEPIQYNLSADTAATLYAITYGRAGLGIPPDAPHFYPVTQSTLDHIVCGREHCGARAAQLGDSIFYLHTLSVDDADGMGVIAHEIVHYLQWVRHGIAQTCEERRARELQAYAVQAAILDRINVRMAVPDIPRCS